LNRILLDTTSFSAAIVEAAETRRVVAMTGFNQRHDGPQAPCFRIGWLPGIAHFPRDPGVRSNRGDRRTGL